jgi:UDP-N-acetylmuramoylalanine--D-glutamate ligase
MVTKNNKNLKVVMGLGKTGISCVRFLAKKGFNIAVIDSRDDPPFLNELKQNFPEIKIHLGNLAAPFLDEANELIISPGISLREPVILKLLEKGIKVNGDIELFAKEANAPIAAITGSNGKSTVTTLLGKMAKNAGINVKVGGNLGVPALELLDANADLYVLELSSFQLETTHSLKAKAATVLNISEDHMDRYRDLTEYAAAKHRIFMNAEIAVINHDDPLTYENIKLPRKIISFSLDKKTASDFYFDNGALYNKENELITTSEIKIKGLHQIANVLAALALGTAINLPEDALLSAIKEFEGLPHRCQFVAKANDISWYNDSKGTNVGATKAAILGLGAGIEGKLILIAGGLGKGANFAPLQYPIIKFVRAVVLIGQDAKKIEHDLQKCCKIHFAQSMEEAVELAASLAKPKDAVLLSPACASFDMFNNFEHRGEVFITAVHNFLNLI